MQRIRVGQVLNLVQSQRNSLCEDMPLIKGGADLVPTLLLAVSGCHNVIFLMPKLEYSSHLIQLLRIGGCESVLL